MWQQKQWGRRREDATLLALKMEEEVTSPGMQQPQGASEGEEMDPPLEPPRKPTLLLL